MSLPALVEPVNEIISISLCEDNCVPTPTPSPLTKLKTPGGNPASCIISANTIPEMGAISEGFKIIVQPAERAGITFKVI